MNLICFDAKIESLQANCTKEVVVFKNWLNLTIASQKTFTYLGKFGCMFS